MLIVSPELRCSNEVLTLVAMLSGASLEAALILRVGTCLRVADGLPSFLPLAAVPNVFLRPQNARKEADMAKAQFVHPDGDHLTLLNVYHAYKSSASIKPYHLPRFYLTVLSTSFVWADEHERNWAYNNFLSQRALQQADNVRSQLRRSMEKHDLDLVSTPFEDKSYYVNIRKALTAGFFMQVAHKEGGKGDYKTIKDNQVVRIHKGSGMETTPEWVCFNEFVLTTSNVRSGGLSILIVDKLLVRVRADHDSSTRSSSGR